jgi:transposase
MNTENRNIKTVITIMKTVMGVQLVKQVLCCILLIFDVDEKRIMAELNVSYNTIKKYSRLLESGKLAYLFEDRNYKPKSEMEAYRDEIMAELDKNPARTLREAANTIEKVTGLKRSLPQVRNFLKKNGYRVLKVCLVPAKANPEEQRSFLETILKPLISHAEEGKIQLFFVDAAHFVQGGFIGQLWSKVRILIKSTSGRSRYNVLGALNFATKRMEIIANDSYITSAQVLMLIDKLINEYPNCVIKLIMDNARYQRCKLVMEYAAARGVEIIFLPTYSPNLNLIERVWKFVKSEVLNAAYIGTFADFKDTIDECLAGLDKKHLVKMKTLITGNFQLFDSHQSGSLKVENTTKNKKVAA